LELRQTSIPPRVGRRIRNSAFRLLIGWGIPVLAVVAFAYAVARRG
jgi:hypothetical protein